MATKKKMTQTVIADGKFYTISAANGKVMEVADFNMDNGAKIQLWDNANVEWQQWGFVAAGDGVYRLQNRFTGKMLDLNMGGVSDGTRVHQWEGAPASSQLWVVEPTNDGRVKIKSNLAGKLLDVTEFNTGDTVGEGATVATLVNDKKLKMSLYFSYAYDGQVKVGQAANISVPAAMYTTAAGKVEKINRVSYITPEGGIYFEVILSFDNPGTLTADMEASAVLFAADGTPIYPYSDGKTEYYETRALTTKAGGPLIKSSLLNYANVTSGQALLTMSSETLDAELATARETLAAAQADLDTLNATAPIDGTIISCTLVEGGEVKAGDAVITISNTATMVVKITVDDRNIGFLKLGDTINLSDYNGNSYMGTVTNIDTQGTVGQGMSTFPVTLEVENYDGSLYSGAWLNYSFVTSQSDDCVLVPTTAVKSVLDTEGNKQTVVFVYRDEKPENTVELDASITNVPTEKDHYYPVAVVTGISDAKAVEIKSGIQDGDQVFINYTVSESSSSWGNY